MFGRYTADLQQSSTLLVVHMKRRQVFNQLVFALLYLGLNLINRIHFIHLHDFHLVLIFPVFILLLLAIKHFQLLLTVHDFLKFKQSITSILLLPSLFSILGNYLFFSASINYFKKSVGVYLLSLCFSKVKLLSLSTNLFIILLGLSSYTLFC